METPKQGDAIDFNELADECDALCRKLADLVSNPEGHYCFEQLAGAAILTLLNLMASTPPELIGFIHSALLKLHDISHVGMQEGGADKILAMAQTIPLRQIVLAPHLALVFGRLPSGEGGGDEGAAEESKPPTGCTLH